MDDPDARRTLSAFDIGCLVVGGIVGVGIFFTPAEVARRVDDASQALGAWALGGFIALCGALVTAELAGRLPGHGGTYLYIREAFGRPLAFLYGWANWLVIQSGALGVIGLVLADNLDIALHGEAATSAGGKVLVAVTAIVVFTLVNVAGLRLGKGVQNTLTVSKLLGVAALVGLAVLTGSDAVAELGDTAGGVGAGLAATGAAPRGWMVALSAALMPVLFSFGGWQQGSFVAGAARHPRRDVPLGLCVGVSVVVVAYLSINVAFLHLLGFEGARASDAIAADAARAALEPLGHGDLAARLLAGLVVLSSLGILNTICLAPPFVLVAMAREGLFFKSVGELNRSSGAPVTAVLVQGLWGAVLLGVLSLATARPQDVLGFLLDGVVFVDWLFYGLCGAALLRLRRRERAAPLRADGLRAEGLRAPGSRAPGFRAPGGGVVAGIFVVFALIVTIGAVVSSPGSSLVGALLCLLGLGAWWGFSRGAAGSTPA